MRFETLTHPVTKVKGRFPVGKTGKPKLVLSGSNQATESSCPSLFLFTRMYQNPQFPSGHAADVGTALHEAYQSYLRSDMWPGLTVAETAEATLLKHYPWETDDQQNAKYRQIEDAYATLHEMVQFNAWPTDFDNAQLVHIIKKDGTQVPATEISFEIFVEQSILPEFDVYISGQIDSILRSPDGVDRRPFIMDIKTTRAKSGWGEKFLYASQCLPYHLMLSHLLGEEIEEFSVVYMLAYISATNPEVISREYVKNRDSIDFYFASFVLLLNKIAAQVKLGHWPRNSNSCLSFGRICNYHAVCGVDRSRTEYIADAILGNDEAYDRYADKEVDFELEISL